MKFLSTKRQSPPVSFFEAMRNGLAPDGGLYMPETIPELPKSFWDSLDSLSFSEIAFQISKPFLGDETSNEDLKTVVDDAFNFSVKLQPIDDQIYILELFHGPTLAFKDFGARFMARLFSGKAQKEDQDVTILVATSGDTGSAVAHGFYKVPGVKVCLLYPAGKVSRLQEQQMATLGENITTLEVDGVFDDCQRLVKQAFVDEDLNRSMQLSSANSINIARLLPQSFYYVFAAAELQRKGISKEPVFSVPSGNFGNLTGGILAMKMGMPAARFIAATNVNDVVPEYLSGSDFTPRNSVHTLSNAMDVGNPSNFIRMKALFDHSDAAIRRHVKGFSYDDDATRQTILDVYNNHHYLICPHTAIGCRAASEYIYQTKTSNPVISLATAHPVKFRDVIEPETGSSIDVPERLGKWLKRDKRSVPIGKGYKEFKEFLMNR